MSKPNQVKSVVFSAPHGWGKTRNKAALQNALGCVGVVDDWRPGMRGEPGALHLTTATPDDLTRWPGSTDQNVVIVTSGWTHTADEYFKVMQA